MIRVTNLLQGLVTLAAIFAFLGIVVLIFGDDLSNTLQTRLVVLMFLGAPVVALVILFIALWRPWLLYGPLELQGTPFGDQAHPQTRMKAMKLPPVGEQAPEVQPKQLPRPKRR